MRYNQNITEILNIIEKLCRSSMVDTSIFFINYCHHNFFFLNLFFDSPYLEFTNKFKPVIVKSSTRKEERQSKGDN